MYKIKKNTQGQQKSGKKSIQKYFDKNFSKGSLIFCEKSVKGMAFVN